MATQPKQSPSEQKALEQFVFHGDQFWDERVPRGLDPEDVAKFVQDRVDRSTSLKAAGQVERVIDFYDASEALTHLRTLLDRSEKLTDETRRSIAYARAFGYAGTPQDVQFAREYYRHLAGRTFSAEIFVELIGLYDALGPGADPQVIVDAVNRLLKTLTPRRAADPQIEQVCLRLEQLLQRDLPYAEKAAAEKTRILKLKDRPRRIQEEIKIYLEVQYAYLDYLHPWSARRLRREVWADHPEQQTTRKADATRSEELVQAFRRMLGSLDQYKDLSEEDMPGAQLRCLRAIEFFGGKPSDEERRLVETQSGMQYDILSSERQPGEASDAEDKE